MVLPSGGLSATFVPVLMFKLALCDVLILANETFILSFIHSFIHTGCGGEVITEENRSVSVRQLLTTTPSIGVYDTPTLAGRHVVRGGGHWSPLVRCAAQHMRRRLYLDCWLLARLHGSTYCSVHIFSKHMVHESHFSMYQLGKHLCCCRSSIDTA